MPIASSTILLVALATLAHPVAAAGQTSPASPDATSPVRAWLSLGIGPAEFHNSSGTSFRGRATVSRNRAVLMFRKTGSFEGIDGHVDHNESSLLAGRRFGEKHLFVIPAVGFGQAHWHDDLCTAHTMVLSLEMGWLGR